MEAVAVSLFGISYIRETQGQIEEKKVLSRYQQDRHRPCLHLPLLGLFVEQLADGDRVAF